MNGFRPNHEPKPRQKPRVLVCILCGSERHNWIAPPLVNTIVEMSLDQRFDCYIEMVPDMRNVDSARNFCVAQAKKSNADFLVMNDNAIVAPISGKKS